ncbi:FAD-linked oxidase C-terminal domain-containing protein [Magnetovibrio sp.]|uniref:FAD-linked oxidase C-terminal domain-containing protein n=1 Tax=Magnetovibrio sp. TaxID=2024836 RepID=UPI002F91C9FF
MTAPSRPIDAIYSQLETLFGARVSINAGVRETHGRGEGSQLCQPPDAVVFPNSTDEISRLAKLCHGAGVPLIPFGAGTSLEGHVAAPMGGVSIDFSNMNAILEVHAEDLDAVVQPGVTRKQLNAHLRDTGLFFPVDPGADATIGGMCATRASGTSTVRYGSMKDNVLAMEVVLADGRVIKTGNRARKSAAGYDLTRLMIGSEGTLGIITAVTVKLHGIPETVTAAVCPFPDIESAVNCVITAVQMGVPMARIELMDAVSMAAVNAYSNLAYAEAPTLFLEFEGAPASVTEQVETLKALAEDLGGTDFQWADKAEDRNRLWSARHTMYYAGLALRPGARALTTDVCVPISNLSDCIGRTHKALEESALTGLILGHVGDGNFHTLLLFDPENPAEVEEAERLNAAIVDQALALEGTCTGEHGVGQGKTKYLRQELGVEAVDVMAQVKAALDPTNILNPGKVIPKN